VQEGTSGEPNAATDEMYKVKASSGEHAGHRLCTGTQRAAAVTYLWVARGL